MINSLHKKYWRRTEMIVQRWFLWFRNKSLSNRRIWDFFFFFFFLQNTSNCSSFHRQSSFLHSNISMLMHTTPLTRIKNIKQFTEKKGTFAPAQCTVQCCIHKIKYCLWTSVMSVCDIATHFEEHVNSKKPIIRYLNCAIDGFKS